MTNIKVHVRDRDLCTCGNPWPCKDAIGLLRMSQTGSIDPIDDSSPTHDASEDWDDAVLQHPQRGRPRKADRSLKRTEKLVISLTKAEHDDALVASARAKHRKIQDYMRELLIAAIKADKEKNE